VTDDFFVGYHPAPPPALARFLHRAAVAAAAGAVGLALVTVRTQDRAAPGVFEYGTTRELSGRLRERPYPMLLAPGAGLTDRQAAYTRYLLVGPGKHGAQAAVAGRDGEWLTLRGTRIARAGREMLEVADGGVGRATPPAPGAASDIPLPAPESLGRLTLTGEIVDAKCWLGVMKPATRGVHRGCAARCISGGAPPLLLVRDDAGHTAELLLTDADGAADPARYAAHAGRDVTLTGPVTREGDLLTMRVEELRD
jgi:hypothetical protein